MRTPGSNLLSEALDCIDTTTVTYYKDAGRQLNAVGMYVTSYEPPVDIEGSVQATSRDTYVQFGLDMQKNYVNIFLPNDTIDLSRDQSGDQFVIGPEGKRYRYQLESEIPWHDYDGWVEVMAVEIGKEPE